MNRTNYRKIWEQFYGPIPKDEYGRSFEIHHIDNNRRNNSINNLLCLSAEDHFKLHYEKGEFAAASVISNRLKNYRFTGWHHTEETKKKLSQSKLGNAWNKGKTYEERYGAEKASELRKRRSERQKEIWTNRKGGISN